MYDLMIYSLKVGACLAVFYLFFKLLLSRETFHRLNRMLLLAAMVLSFVLPICVIEIYHEVPALPEITEFVGIPVVMDTKTEPFPWDRIAGGVFLLGAIVTLGAMFCSLASVIRLIRRGRREPLDAGMVLVRVDRPVTPFSWGRYIVLSEQDAAESGHEIITHERAHLRLRHSWDLLVTDVAGCLQWFNPAMWLLRRELRAIHEYEADEAVLNSGVDAKQYQLLLIKKAAGGRWYSVANSFNHSKLKNRITMMLQKRSSRWAGAKALLVLPLIGLALGAFAETAYVYPTDKGTKENDTIPAPKSEVVVVGYRAEAEAPLTTKTADTSRNGATDAPKMVQIKKAPAVVRDTLPNESMKIRISRRSNDYNPLIIIDGVRSDQQKMSVIDPSQIEQISVLKEKSAIESYGSEGANGVILVTTKKAKAAADAVKVTTDDPIKVIGVGVLDKGVLNGESVEVKINGLSSGLNPLIIIDGVRSDQQKMSVIAPSQIESITVLKDNTSIEMYGTEGAKGVILVTTKKAKAANNAVKVANDKPAQTSGNGAETENKKELKP